MLTERDELFHAPPEGGAERWQENLFFILWDPAELNGFMVHLQRVPRLGWQEAQAVAVIGGRTVSATLRRPFSATSSMAEMAMSPVEPFVRWHLRADFAGAPGPGPLGFCFTEPSGPVPVTADLHLQSVLEPTDFAHGLHAVVEALSSDPAGSQMGQQQHYEQGGTWHGRLRIGDDQVDASGLFVRDHSWGVRHEQNDFRAFWTATCLDGGTVFANAIGIHQPDRVVGIGAVTDRTGTRFTTDVAADFAPAPGIASYERATVRYGTGVDLTVGAISQLHIPMYLPHSGARRYDNNALSVVEAGGRSGFAVVEWADVLTPAQAAAVDRHGFAADSLTLL